LDWGRGRLGPLANPSQAERVLDDGTEEPALVGIRDLINVEPDPDWVIPLGF
jgi:hypothetical protein